LNSITLHSSHERTDSTANAMIYNSNVHKNDDVPNGEVQHI